MIDLAARCIAPRLAAAALLGAGLGAAWADTVDARCEVRPRHAEVRPVAMPCTFSQRQGVVGIDRADGVRTDLQPRQGASDYADALQRPVRRVAVLGARGLVFRLPDETVRVLWSTAGLADVPPPPAAEAVPPFERTLELQGIRFHLRCDNAGAINTLEIRPEGLAADNTPIVRRIDGRAVGAEVADLDVDGSPEVYVYIRSAGVGGYGSLAAFSANRRKSLSEIVLPPLDALPRAVRGYGGHDEFAVVERTLVRRFHVYRPGDTLGAPGGGMRQLQYKLARGEATWRLRVDRVVAY